MTKIAIALEQVGGRTASRDHGAAPRAACTSRPATPPPRFLQIEPVGQCNLRCRMCPVGLRPESAPGHRPAHIDFGLFARLLDQFAGVAELQLQGLGEPMLHPQFFDMVALAAARGMRVSTNTNLTLLTEARAARCVDSGLAHIHVSIDGASAATYEHIRVRASFAKVMRNLQRLMRAKARAASARPQVRWVMVVMRRNLHELAAVVRLAHEHGVGEIHVQHLCHDFAESTLPAQYLPMRRFVDEQTLAHDDAQRVAAHFEAARAEAAARGIELRLPQTAPRAHAPGTPGRARCDWPWHGAYVSWDGRSMPCCMVSTPDRASFGDYARDGVAAVWDSAAATDFRERLDAGAPPEVCRGCSIWHGTF